MFRNYDSQAGDNWAVNSPQESLAYILSNAGYDVWIGNNRCVQWSHGHQSYSPSDNVTHSKSAPGSIILWTDAAPHIIWILVSFMTSLHHVQLHSISHCMKEGKHGHEGRVFWNFPTRWMVSLFSQIIGTKFDK